MKNPFNALVRWLAVLMATWILPGCSEPTPAIMVGQLESVRTQLSGPVAENLVELWVTEGQQVVAGERLFRLDDDLARAAVRRAEAALAVADAALAETLRGPRPEQIAAARAQHQQAREELHLRVLERQRARDLHSRQVGSADALDRAATAHAMASARVAEAAARLSEFEAGSTAEQRALAAAKRQQASAELELRELELKKLTVSAVVAGVVDQILIEVGERAAAGQPVLTLLNTKDTYARIYVPAALRSRAKPGEAVQILLQGESVALSGQLRWVSAEAAFTPYFALTSEDRDRLTYVAEVTLAKNSLSLPSGLPLQAQFVER